MLSNFTNLISHESFLRIRDIFLKICVKIGVNNIFRVINKKKYVILWYHGISNRNIKFSYRHVASNLFENQVKYLRDKNYTFVTLTELVKILKINKKLSQRYAVLTFDDGFKDVVRYGYPIMQKYKAKGCFYIVSDIIGKDELLWTDYLDVLIRKYSNKNFKFHFKNNLYSYSLKNEREIKQTISDITGKLRSISNTDRLNYLKEFKPPNKLSELGNVPFEYLIASWEDIISLDDKILEIGCHTKSHPNLDTLSDSKEFRDEIYESKIDIETKLNKEIKHLCYPAGAFNDEVVGFTKKFGFDTGTTTVNGLNSLKSDLLRLKRIMITNNMIEFKGRVSGLLPFIKNLVERFISFL